MAVVGSFVCLLVIDLTGTAYYVQGTLLYSARQICGLLVGVA